jgi:hypothetical protein
VVPKVILLHSTLFKGASSNTPSGRKQPGSEYGKGVIMVEKVIGRAVMVSLSIAGRYQRVFLWLVACAGGW